VAVAGRDRGHGGEERLTVTVLSVSGVVRAEMFEPDERSRRDLLKAAVAIGGSAGLSACLGWLGADSEPVPRGDGTTHERQFTWNDRVPSDGHGNTRLPRHQVLLYLDYDREGPPTAADRETVEAAFASLDEAYERSNEGLLYSVAYSPAYFDRFEASLPETVDLPPPRRLSDFESPTLDEQDALVHLASDRPDAVLGAERALLGERDAANGVETAASLADVMTVDSRRTGFVGEGMPAARQNVEGVPDSNPVPKASPLFMGFKAGFAGNQATEEYVTIDAGLWRGATTKHVANLRQRLDDWYVEHDRDERVEELFSPAHAERGLVEGAGENLGDHNGLTPEMMETIREQAAASGRVGHAQKAARANRDEAGNVRLLRRHFESIDAEFSSDGEGFPDQEGGVASLHFPSLQRGISAFEEVREAMNGTDLTDIPAIRTRVNNGILEYVFVRHRGNFLVPPTELRALPPVRPER